MSSFLRARMIPLLVALSVMLLSNVALASHFRFGTITWSIPDPIRAPRNVRFVVTHGWALNNQNSVTLDFGDGTRSAATLGTNTGTGTDVAGERYTIYQFTVDHTYAGTSAGPFTVFFASCCRISRLVNGGDANFRVQTLVSLTAGNTAGPSTNAPAIVPLSGGARRTYLFPVFDPDFDPITCRLATSAESGLPAGQDVPSAGGRRPTVSATSGGCLLDWDLTSATNGQRYVLAIVVESTHGGARSAAPLDVIIEISTRPSPTCTGSGTFTAPVGQPFSTMVTGTNPAAGTLTMTAIGVPTGATLNPVAGTARASPFATTFAWTPTTAFLGTTQSVLINYRNVDGLTATCFLTIQVPTCNNFGTPCTVGVGACQRMGTNVCAGPGMTVCNVTAGTPGTETCNGIDDDCDGMTDEGSLCSGSTPVCSTPLRRCVQCLTNANCPSSAPVCEVAMGVCRPCNIDAECGGATPACIAGRGCVQCTATNPRACTGATPVCNVTANTCVQCNTNAECGGRTPICNTTTRTCGPCTADAQCGGTTPACATGGANQGACVQCTATNGAVCRASMTVCDNATNRCVRCTTDADCGGSTPVCERTTNTCRACRADAECRAPSPACGATGACVQCTATNATACTGATPVCDVAASRCVQCNTNAQCGGNTPVCDLPSHMCRPCQADRDCGGATPACGPMGACVQCTMANATACAGMTPVCNVAANTCVQCNTNAQCSGSTPVCETATRRCRGCSGDGECGGMTPACGSTGACVQCTMANASACRSPTSVCNPTTSTCVQCLVDAQCSGNTPVCQGNVCRGCRSDMECATREGATACSATGACVQCTATNTRACPMETPVCNPTDSRCVLCTPGVGGDASRCAMSRDGRACIPPMMTGESFACGCLTDADCGDATSGRVCDPTTRRCVSGCAAGPNRNGCPMGQSCTADAPGEVGMCTTTCNRNADCTGSTPLCRISGRDGGGMNACVECLGDENCATRMDGRSLCDPASNRCVQCTESSTASCMAAGAGRACLMGVCSCMRDADCGGPTSGRVCDMETRQCRAGCTVGEGRNGCPTGQSCTSDDPTTIGMCTTTCNRDADCMSPTPRCRTAAAEDAGAASACVECLNDAHCAGRTEGRTLCDTGSATCVQCTDGNRAMCMASGPGGACLMGACGCVADSDCGDRSSGRVCDPSSRRCRAGCAPGDGRNGCPTGQSCTSDDPSMIGTCTTTCNRNADCMAPRPVCVRAEGGMNSLCVECGADTHCAMRADGRTRCDASSGTCVQCTAMDRTGCKGSGAGSACLSNGTCGCTGDVDCASDRRCDMASGRCEPRPVMPDAGVPDAGMMKPADAGMDGGATTPDGELVGSGCSCRAGATPSARGAAPWLALALLALLRRRRDRLAA